MSELRIGTLDFETDPFLFGRIPYPFASGIYFSDNDYRLLWEPDILKKTICLLKNLSPCILYAHNGGKFDFHYLLESADHENIVIRNGRVVQMQIGKVTLKDSWPLMPFPLEEFRKTPIDYAIFEARRRNALHNKIRIQSYMLDDCRDLCELIKGFRNIVGPKDTIGSAAFYQMRELGIKIRSLNESHDNTFRPYFFGGRVEAFKKGIHAGPLLYLDINSAYPFAMLNDHPHGNDYMRGNKLPLKNLGPCFVHCIADSDGALPMRGDDGSLHFARLNSGEFFATGWEIKAGLKTRTLCIKKILEVWRPQSFINFETYVQTFFKLRQEAKVKNDPIGRLAYKYLLNAGYGKFAQNPRDFKRYKLSDFGNAVQGYSWESDFGAISLWSQNSYDGFGFFDVATSASITGYVRAMLWQTICRSKNVLYVDTDSMVCKSSRVSVGDSIGQWKQNEDNIIRECAIAGKKLYGIDWGKRLDPKDPDSRYKISSKGARLTYAQIVALCSGKSIIWRNAAPTFSLSGTHFVKREITAT